MLAANQLTMNVEAAEQLYRLSSLPNFSSESPNASWLLSFASCWYSKIKHWPGGFKSIQGSARKVEGVVVLPLNSSQDKFGITQAIGNDYLHLGTKSQLAVPIHTRASSILDRQRGILNKQPLGSNAGRLLILARLIFYFNFKLLSGYFNCTNFLLFQVSDFRFQISNLKFHASNFQISSFHLKCLISTFLLKNILNQVTDC